MKLRICHITEASSGGVLTHLKQLAEEIDAQKYHQTFIVSSIKNKNIQNVDFCGSRVCVIDMMREIRPFHDFVSLVKLIRFFYSEKFDVIHCHSSKAGVLGRLAAKITGHKVVFYSPHAFAFNNYISKWKSFFYKSIERAMSVFTTQIVCVSLSEYTQAIEERICRNNKLVLIRNGIKINPSSNIDSKKDDFLTKYGISKKAKIVCFMGRLSKQKNPPVFIEAISYIKEENHVALIIGDGELRNELRSQCERLQIWDKIIFLGEIENPLEILQFCDIYVSTSLWEGMPYAILEAVGLNIPVIASDIPGVTDVIENDVSGLLFSPMDFQRLSELIRELLNDRTRAGKLAVNAKKIVETDYSLSQMVLSIQNLYDSYSLLKKR